eukprot:TRINITY_DN2009_c0_g1_i2.p1 TRINITY_DN2009_c0_g1~~TRINITY_DN2009_c0_g1_i2.p1  ORF type:complete len:266 (-),score=17.73 TRINITY_DN2009_c0_g1_i2:67-864(-)
MLALRRFGTMTQRQPLRIGLLVCDSWSNYPEIVQKFGDVEDQYKYFLGLADGAVETKSFNCINNEFPTKEDIDPLDGVIVTGSKFSAYDDIPWIHKLKEQIVSLDKESKKLLGICFGHQIISLALGGKVERIGWNLSHQTIRTDPTIVRKHHHAPVDTSRAGDNVVQFLASHQDQVTLPAPGMESWATNDACKYQGLMKGSHLVTIQAHPEFRGAFLADLLIKKDIIPQEKLQPALAQIYKPTDSASFSKWVHEFFSEREQSDAK